MELEKYFKNHCKSTTECTNRVKEKLLELDEETLAELTREAGVPNIFQVFSYQRTVKE